jgi:hypothetical protein
MLPDFRFILGAILALTMLAVGGLGLVTSVRLVREAHMAPLESRSLAYAGHAEWNQFYDPESARRFEGLSGKTEAPVSEARREPPAETSALAPPEPAPPAIAAEATATPAIAPPAVPPAAPEEPTAAIPAHAPEPVIAAEIAPVEPDDNAPEKAPEKTPEADPPTPPAEASAPDGERLASLPVPSPGSDPGDEARTPAQEPAPAPAQPQAAGAEPQGAVPPTPRARPKAHFHRRIARARIRTVPSATQQPPENSGFPPYNAPAPWPGYDNQFTGTTTKKNAGKLTGR